MEQRYQLMKFCRPALAWVTIAQFAMRGAFHLMIKKIQTKHYFSNIIQQNTFSFGQEDLETHWDIII